MVADKGKQAPRPPAQEPPTETHRPFAFSAEGRVGSLAVRAGLITEQQLAWATREQEKTGRSLVELLGEVYGLSAETVGNLLAEDAGLERVDLGRVTFDPEAAKKVPAQFACEHKLLPISLTKDRLLVAMANPFELAVLDQLQFRTRLYIDARYAPESQILALIPKVYEGFSHGLVAVEQPAQEQGHAAAKPEESIAGGHVIRLVDALLQRAIREEATDIHVEPEEKRVQVRFRIDGILYLRPEMGKLLQPAITTRIKIMANMDISENRLPQDGRLSVRCDGKAFDVRVSTFPTIQGEKLVLRILDKERAILGLEQLGLSPSALAIFKKCAARPNGIVLVTGPTGSGKTTTLYSTLNFVNSSETNIMTLEDPVEYELSFIRQSQINPKAGLTFASGLRAMLRQDPDIILVGEMRDSETADVAIRAALTGHLVFSTLHTNDAVGAVTRLLDMGVEPSLIASTIVAVAAQRLVRKICVHCRVETTPDEAQLQSVGLSRADLLPHPASEGAAQAGESRAPLGGDPTDGKVLVKGGKRTGAFYRGKGCAHCFQTGYRGRLGVFEILTMSSPIAQMITQRSPAHVILKKAREEGMVTMLEDGIEKASRGVTTLDEIIRVAYAP